VKIQVCGIVNGTKKRGSKVTDIQNESQLQQVEISKLDFRTITCGFVVGDLAVHRGTHPK
jgi:hypothetical protein